MVPGTGDGDAEGLICGNRLEALPAGIVVDTPATAGSAPSGMAAPTLSVVPDRPGMFTVDPPGVLAPGAPAAAPGVVLELGLADEVIGSDEEGFKDLTKDQLLSLFEFRETADQRAVR